MSAELFVNWGHGVKLHQNCIVGSFVQVPTFLINMLFSFSGEHTRSQCESKLLVANFS